MSSSHLFLGLPIALLVLYLVLSSVFQSAAFLSHLSLGEVAILSASFHIIFCESCSSIESLRFKFFYDFFSASLHVFNPIFFFDRCVVNFFISIVFKRNITVHVIVSCCDQSSTAPMFQQRSILSEILRRREAVDDA